MPPVPRRKLALGAAAAARVLAAAGAFAIPKIRHSKETHAEKERRAQAALVSAERRRLARDQRPHTAMTSHRPLVTDLERAITADARARVRAGRLDGPILRTTCERSSIGGEERLARVVARYKCEAVTATSSNLATGYSFVATIRYRDRSLIWCKLNPRPGEGGRALVSVKVSRACAGRLSEVL